MHYDDASRRLNLLSGFVFGTALGAGLALLLLPRAGRGTPARRKVSPRRAGRLARRSLRARGRADRERGRERKRERHARKPGYPARRKFTL